ncbi:uncharacterized protein F4822DRAFT_408914 [Hypoxylon trugodes]|uniref:uncharacterized protein n=1 Tax=Hypoxylon trugodes TaxID=326681 RepID=UPI002195E3F7|nr:uncharacterized protein F4822DRAFT_408914 [Hypoxylon trugodes]KAI1386095.1 hypothetical protein F4822DRAFT_408914 [Hypoxylon trugodes]
MSSSNSQSPPDHIPRYGGRAESFKRQNTADSTRSTRKRQRTESFLVRARREQESARPRGHQEKYPVYAGLSWEALQGYLLKRWPNETFKEERRDDNWVFQTPEPLTEKDKAEINKLRDSISQGRRDSVSPEP